MWKMSNTVTLLSKNNSPLMISAYYDRICLWSAIDFEQKNHFCLAGRGFFPPAPVDARANLHETHFLADFTPFSLKNF